MRTGLYKRLSNEELVELYKAGESDAFEAVKFHSHFYNRRKQDGQKRTGNKYEPGRGRNG